MSKLEYKIYEASKEIKTPPTIIFIHGAMCSYDFWQMQLRKEAFIVMDANWKIFKKHREIIGEP